MNHALMLVGWDVTGIKVTGNVQEATASYQSLLDTCPKCGSVGSEGTGAAYLPHRLYRHGVKTVEYRDAPAFGKQFVIRCRVQRFRCRECGETSMQPLPDMDTRRRMTKRCVEYIEQQGAVRTYADIARTIGIDEKTVRNICNEAFDRALAARRIETPRILGIDELTLLGRKRTLFIDAGGKRVLDLIDAMNRGKVERWLMRLPDREAVRAVTIDMWGPYKAAVKATLPNAKIVVDKWHVLSKLNMALDRVRNRARREAGIRRNPQKGRRLLQTSRHNLSPWRRATVDGMLADSPLIDAAWHAKEVFYDIWDIRPRAAAEELFDRWAATIPPAIEGEFRPIAQMVENWREEIFAFFDYPLTNAYTEAINGLIKIANRAGRGYSFETIRAKTLLSEPFAGRTAKCDGCLGQFPEANVKPLDIMAPRVKEVWHARLCGNCHHTFHTEAKEKFEQGMAWLSTRKS